MAPSALIMNSSGSSCCMSSSSGSSSGSSCSSWSSSSSSISFSGGGSSIWSSICSWGGGGGGGWLSISSSGLSFFTRMRGRIASLMPCCTSSADTLSRPFSAACARAILPANTSARWPSHMPLADSSAKRRCWSSVMVTSFKNSRAKRSCVCICWISAALSAAVSAGFMEDSRAQVTARMRSSRSVYTVWTSVLSATASRSIRCGRRGPSSGFHVATISGLHGCLTERPSRSTWFTPLSTAVSSKLTRSSWSKFTSSMYKTPRCALASKPGSKIGLPCSIDA
mmetsp:Transcript_80300/g.245443  ORF Transcript_80300/g.245443 Transcript_80300/m.245443 type:complete len:282 (-) Transcript_80300:407-1252(-)